MADITVLGAGVHNYTYYTTGCTNYIFGRDEKMLTVNAASPSITLLLDSSTTSSQSRTYPNSSWFNITETNDGDTDCTYDVKINGTAKSDADFTDTLASRGYNVTGYVESCTNYTNKQFDIALLVNKATPTLTLSPTTQGITYGTTVSQTCVENNPESNGCQLLRGFETNPPDVNITLLNDSTERISVGTWYYNASVEQTENYTHGVASVQIITVSKAEPTCGVSPSTQTITYGESVTQNCTSTNPETRCSLWRDGVNVTHENNTSPVLGVLSNANYGFYIYTSTSDATQNYSSCHVPETYVTVNRAPSIIYLYLNGSRSSTTIPVGSAVNATGVLQVGYESTELKIYNVTQLLASAPRTVVAFPTFGKIGLYNVSASYIGPFVTENYTTSSDTFWVTVIEIKDDQKIANTEIVEVEVGTTEIIIPKETPLQRIEIPITVPATQQILLNFSDVVVNTSMRKNVTIGLNNFTLTREAATANYSVEIPAQTIISAPLEWDGLLSVPTVNVSSFSAPAGEPSASTVDVVIEVGSTVELNFTNPVKVVIGGQAGKRAGWTRGGSTLTKITTECNSTTDPTNINETGPRECYIDDGNDLVVWTYHFTQFAAYTPIEPAPVEDTTTSSSGGGGGGGGGSGSVYIVICDVNGICEEGETSEDCPSDCGEGVGEDIVEEEIEEETEEEVEGTTTTTIGRTGPLPVVDRITGAVTTISADPLYRFLFGLLIMTGGLVVIRYGALKKKRKVEVPKIRIKTKKIKIPKARIPEIKNILIILATSAVLYVAYLKKSLITGMVEGIKGWAGKSISKFVVDPTSFDLMRYVFSLLPPGAVQILIRFGITAVALGGSAILIVRIYRTSRVPWKRIKFNTMSQQRALLMMKHKIRPTFRYGFKLKGDNIVSVSAKKMLPKIKVPDMYKSRKSASRILPDISDYFEFPSLKKLMPKMIVVAAVGLAITYAANFGVPEYVSASVHEFKMPTLCMPSQISGAFAATGSFVDGFVGAYGFKAVAGVFVAGAVVVLARGHVKRRRNPWRTDHYKTNKKDAAVERMRKNVRKMMEKENWVRNL